jgi:hypothetical protein
MLVVVVFVPLSPPFLVVLGKIMVFNQHHLYKSLATWGFVLSNISCQCSSMICRVLGVKHFALQRHVQITPRAQAKTNLMQK